MQVQLVVVADADGRIVGLTPSAVEIKGDPDSTQEVSIRAESVGGVETFRSHVIDLPAHLVGRTGDDLIAGVREIPERMYLDVGPAEVVLRQRGAGSD
jgi:hypothetical protein